MKRLLISSFAILCIANFVLAQFASVKDGDWRDPLTWSTDPQATAIPDSTKDVIIQHYVTVSGLYNDSWCKSMTVTSTGTMSNYTSAWVGSHLRVQNNLLNFGTISPSNDGFYVTVKGDFINHGTIKNHHLGAKFQVYLYGNLVNNGSFRKISDFVFQGNGVDNHVHKVKSLNDSTIFLANAMISDAKGKVLIDSIAILSSTSFNLNGGVLEVPKSTNYENKVYFEVMNLMYGTLEGNGNIVRCKPGTSLAFGANYNTQTNTYISNTVFDCTVSIGGGSSRLYHVIMKGENIVRGLLMDWYQGGYWTADDRGLRVEGKLINEGEIRNATIGTGNGLWLFLEDGSEFINKNDSLKIEAMFFNGHCKFSNEKDTLDVEQWTGTDSTTVLELTKSVWFDQTITIDMKGGKLVLPEKGEFKALHMWYNRLRNARIEANFSKVFFPTLDGNCLLNNTEAEYLHMLQDTKFTGTTTSSYLVPYSYVTIVASMEGDFINKGIIKDHPNYGYLTLHLKANAISKGTEWRGSETRMNGSKNQHLIIPDTSYLKGKVIFDAMITGSSYKWQKDGVDIPGATNATLIFNSGINASHFGLYQCIADGSVPSRTIFIGTEIPAAFTITDVRIKTTGPSSALISWQTSVPASGFVFYAENDNSQGHPFEAMEGETLKTNHRIELTGLTTGATIYFIIDQNDADWNSIRSGEFQFVAGDLSLGALKIKSIVDVPADQGRWVHVNFEADMLDSEGDITQYGIWQWNEDKWIAMGHVPAIQQAEYTFLAHTYHDSTAVRLNWSKFYITAHTSDPLVYYACPVDSGYSIDNLIPSVPTGLQGVRSQKGSELSWNANPDPDIQYYSIYRNGHFLAYTEKTSYIDEVFLTGDGILIYTVSATDFSGNKSAPSPEIQLVISGLTDPSTTNFGLTNAPNPVVDRTVLSFELPMSTNVQLKITDLSGKQIALLVDQEMSSGLHQVEFLRSGLGSGVYFCQLVTNEGMVMHKIMLR